MESAAEEKKNQGNEEFKKGNHLAAIKLYSEALGMTLRSYLAEISLNEGVLTNRALAYQKLNRYAEALEDCDECIRTNSKFTKAYLRAYQVLVQKGDIDVIALVFDYN